MKFIDVNDAQIPALGFGTFRLRGRDAQRMVRVALDTGYRHIDTAESYGNEEAVGRAIRASGVPRDEIFLTTKVWPDHFAADELPAAVNHSLQRLGVDYVDLLLLHWPNPGVPLEETIGALNAMQKAGKTRLIGVSNFTLGLMDNARSLTAVPLSVNQVEYHPFLDQSALLNAIRDNGMVLTAYSPLAKGKVTDDDTLKEIAAEHGKTAAQVSLRWLIQQENVAAIPKASSQAHAEENFDVFDFELSDEEMKTIHKLSRPDGRLVNPAQLAPDWGSQESANVPVDSEREMAGRR
ncbi:MAG: aldo/keto reductase [Candidatus Promineifilaceae bacterium]|nr:aldo/keto reductase [Candidatus Promineifilaceae bacterium]